VSKSEEAIFLRKEEAALARIAESEDPKKLEVLIVNAKRLGSARVADAAFRKRASLLSEGEPGSVEYDFWRSIHTLEGALTDERGKTTRLARTRQKLGRAGVVKTLADLSLAKTASEGFVLLKDRDLLDLSAEAVILRHRKHFEDDAIDAASNRLAEAGYDASADYKSGD